MSILFFILLTLGIAGRFFLTVFNPMASRPKTFNNGYTCGSKGCEQVENGDYSSLEACQITCKSYLKESGKCVTTNGVPWNSYASEELCLASN